MVCAGSWGSWIVVVAGGGWVLVAWSGWAEAALGFCGCCCVEEVANVAMDLRCRCLFFCLGSEGCKESCGGVLGCSLFLLAFWLWRGCRCCERQAIAEEYSNVFLFVFEQDLKFFFGLSVCRSGINVPILSLIHI